MWIKLLFTAGVHVANTSDFNTKNLKRLNRVMTGRLTLIQTTIFSHLNSFRLVSWVGFKVTCYFSWFKQTLVGMHKRNGWYYLANLMLKSFAFLRLSTYLSGLRLVGGVLFFTLKRKMFEVCFTDFMLRHFCRL